MFIKMARRLNPVIKNRLNGWAAQVLKSYFISYGLECFIICLKWPVHLFLMVSSLNLIVEYTRQQLFCSLKQY